MTLLQLAVVAIIQGATEFLPVSSSGHLVLVPAVTGWPDQGLVIDIAAHAGSLAAVILYMWREILMMIAGLARPRRRDNPGLALVGHAVLATAPLVVAGAAVLFLVGDALRSVAVVGWATLLFGVLLYAADRFAIATERLRHMTARRALAIGLFQAFALIPGASRAGAAITAARLLGFGRTDAARFSMLLSIPAILAASGAGLARLVADGAPELYAGTAIVAGIAFAAAFAAILLMMNWIRRASFAPFAAYRILLGAALLFWAYA